MKDFGFWRFFFLGFCGLRAGFEESLRGLRELNMVLRFRVD